MFVPIIFAFPLCITYGLLSAVIRLRLLIPSPPCLDLYLYVFSFHQKDPSSFPWIFKQSSHGLGTTDPSAYQDRSRALQAASGTEASNDESQTIFKSLEKTLMSKSVEQIQDISQMPLSVASKPLVLVAAENYGLEQANRFRLSEWKELVRSKAWRSFEQSEYQIPSYTGALMSYLKWLEPGVKPRNVQSSRTVQVLPSRESGSQRTDHTGTFLGPK